MYPTRQPVVAVAWLTGAATLLPAVIAAAEPEASSDSTRLEEVIVTA